MGHILTRTWVCVVPTKIESMKFFLCLNTLKGLCSFLGLMSYYRKFVNKYEQTVASLSTLLKNNSFVWNYVEEKVFFTLKEDMYIIHVLVVPNFTKIFILKCDSFGISLGVVLMKEGFP